MTTMYDAWGAPVHLKAGVRCGSHGRDNRVYHESAEAVRRCYAVRNEMEAEQAAELAAEQAYERHLEDRGYDDARAQEVYEQRNGVVPFDQAYRNACPEAFADEDEV